MRGFESPLLRQFAASVKRLRRTFFIVLNSRKTRPRPRLSAYDREGESTFDQYDGHIIHIGACGTCDQQPIYRLQGVVGIIVGQNLMNR